MMTAELVRTVTELRDAFGRAKTLEDLQLCCDVAAELGKLLFETRVAADAISQAETSLKKSIERLEKLKVRT